MTSQRRPFWEHKTLAQLTVAEWESLCDGCGKCCLHKLEDEDTGEVYHTCVACRYLDRQNGGCTAYAQRFELVSDCIDLRPQDIGQLNWLPSTCAYRLLDEGKPLPAWHPLISGSRATVQQAGVSVSGRIVSEDDVDEDSLEDYIVHWVE